jgi:lysyl endopeptidase
MKTFLFSIFFFTFNILFSQTKNLGEPFIFNGKNFPTTKYYKSSIVNNEEEISIENARIALSKDKMYRFGKELEVSLNIFDLAEKTILPNGNVLFQFGIESKNAVSINLVFDKFELADGVNLFIVDPIRRKFDGAYTSFNNNSSKMLGTSVLYSEKIIIEILVPKEKLGLSKLNLGTIVHGYRSLNDVAKNLNSSGSCEIDVNCPLGIGWENQRNSVAMMVNGGGFCTGSLVNNTSGTIIPYFLSANHCGTNPGGWVFMFRWESPENQADCGTNAPSVDGPTNMTINGGTLCAANAASDFTLTLLNQSPDPAWGIYYNGWDRSDIPATQLTGIHHPAGDIKKISRDNSTAISTVFNGTGVADSHWGVPSWDQGVTEGGSSGSPLFNQDHRTIGQLHGGDSQCGVPVAQLNDQYGKFHTSWSGGGTNTTRLSNWLDPDNVGSVFIDGIDPAVPNLTVDAGLSNPQVHFQTLCGGDLTPEVTLYNAGSDTLFSGVIHYGFDGATNLTFNWSDTLAIYETAILTLPIATLGTGSHIFKSYIENTSGVDQSIKNDTVTSSFTTIIGGTVLTLNMIINCYANENSWEVVDNVNNVVASGGGYSDVTPVPIIDSFCIVLDCFTFKLHDSYGDGIFGEPATDCNEGSYTLVNEEGIIISELTQANSSFGSLYTSQFCSGIEELEKLEDILIYPNPSSTFITISHNNIRIENLEITSILGQHIYSNNSIQNDLMIDVSNLSKGIYILKLNTEKGLITEQLLIK